METASVPAAIATVCSTPKATDACPSLSSTAPQRTIMEMNPKQTDRVYHLKSIAVRVSLGSNMLFTMPPNDRQLQCNDDCYSDDSPNNIFIIDNHVPLFSRRQIDAATQLEQGKPNHNTSPRLYPDGLHTADVADWSLRWVWCAHAYCHYMCAGFVAQSMRCFQV
ncbi:hypothetical protein AC1031_016401 [Aphanomyces cochlioides]|nr:hypothetical protein AC1031_016401 [Aphanomyces cochlioides]